MSRGKGLVGRRKGIVVAVARTGKGLGYSDRRTEPIFFARTIVLATSLPGLCEKRARKELAVLLLVKPSALDIE